MFSRMNFRFNFNSRPDSRLGWKKLPLTAWLWLVLFQSCTFPVYALILPSAPVVLPSAGSPQAWKITKLGWSSHDEKNFQQFIQRIGEAVEARECRTVTECLTSSANSYHKSDPAGLKYKADCADYPYYLRAYFAWKNGLPYSLATRMKYRNVPNNSDRDLRYSRYGNEVAERFSTISVSAGQFKNAVSILNDLIRNNTSSANFRFHYADDKADLFTDFYPVQITREAVQVGTVIYDPNGHVAVVYKISDDGKIFYMDAHPDNSITTGTFGKKFIRSNPGQGAGFKNFRPQKLVNATLTEQGFYLGGKIVPSRNSELSDYSVEQFFGNADPGATENNPDWTKANFVIDGKALSYYEYVRQRMSVGSLAIHPVDELRSLLSDLCQSLKDRVLAVEIAIKAGISVQPHPVRLPENIYGTHGDWETYSTPSRDTQLKVSFNDLIHQAQDLIMKWRGQDPSLVYSGTSLPRDLLETYQKESIACEFSYTNSNRRAVTLNLEEVRQRIFKLSFDPYHCVELRWGAQNPDELSSCRDPSNKRLWYEREQRLRNQEIRQYEARMDFSLEDLLKPLPGNGKEFPPDVDLPAFLLSEIEAPAVL